MRAASLVRHCHLDQCSREPLASVSWSRGTLEREGTMNPAKIERVRKYAVNLAAELRDIARRTDGFVRLLVGVDLEPHRPDEASKPVGLIDVATFTVQWQGKVCHLGYTISFRLLKRLYCQRDEFVPHQQLLDDVWEGPRSPSALRSAVADLRARLSRAGMRDLARAIDGHNPGHYGLLLRGLRLARRSD